MSSIMAVGLMCALGFGLLVWYYSAALRRPAHVAEMAKALATSHAQGEMPLPSLGVIIGPPLATAPDAKSNGSRLTATTPSSDPHPSSADPTGHPLNVAPTGIPPALGALPVVPGYVPEYAAVGAASGRWNVPPQAAAGSTAPTPAERALERRLSGPVFARQSEPSGSTSPETVSAVSTTLPADSGVAAAATSDVSGSAAPRRDELTTLLTPSATPAALARVLPTQRLLLPQGAFIDCTLETAIDSTLPGMTTCITATDTFSADGKVVLLERGSKLVGETRGEVQQGSARVFVLWTEARTPTGVVIPLASPGTDELGRSGLSGQVDRHFWERFGAAILISIIDAAGESAVQSASSTVIYNPTASQDVMADVLKDTLRIPPTVVKNQGDRIQVLVARDLDFRSVYELRAGVPNR